MPQPPKPTQTSPAKTSQTKSIKKSKKKFVCGFVSILGRPNAGKSTLMNALLGTKIAIVAARPQTTQNAIQGVVNAPGAQIVFVDTPGIHKSNTLLNRRMMDDVRTSAPADVILFLVDSTSRVVEEDSQAVDLVRKAAKPHNDEEGQSATPVIAVFNKIDALSSKSKVLNLIEHYRGLYDFDALIPISAKSGDSLDVLQREIIQRLPTGPALFPEDHLTDQPERFLAAELIREQALRLTREEVPHALAVMIERWEEVGQGPVPTLVRIAATIYVERQGQKTIVIGAGGSMLKKIGTLARREIEKLTGKKVFLETFVKVQPNWREDPEFLAATHWRTMLGE
ncbi:MAG: GTPase Era [Acidobacteriota bacterium]